MDSIARRRIKRKRSKFIRAVLLWLTIIITVTGLFWQLDKVLIMQEDTLNKLNEIDVEVAYKEIKTTETITATVTAYCEGTTNAAGEKPVIGTVAAPRCIPLNTRVKINGVIYIVKDRTNIRYDKGLYDPETRFDIYMGDQEIEKCYEFGKQVLEIEML